MNYLKYFYDKKIYCICDSDLDGVGSRVIAEYFLKPISDIKIINYSDRDFKELEDDIYLHDIVIFVDIAPTVDMYESLIAEGKEVFIFDHHQTSYEELEKCNINELHYVYDIKRSGCKILFDSLTIRKRTKPVVRHFVNLVNTYDTWDKESDLFNEAKSMKNLLYTYKIFSESVSETTSYDLFVRKILNKFKYNTDWFLNQFEQSSLKEKKKMENERYKDAKKSLRIDTDSLGNKFIYIEVQSYISEVSNRLLEEYIDSGVKYCIARNTFHKAVKDRKLSIRSIDYDVRPIAEKWGGGGHENASGIAMESEDDYKNLISGNLVLA